MARLINATTGELLAADVDRARNLWQRTVGLIPRDRLEPDQGLWIDQCSAIHTIGMRCAIDVWFLDRRGRLVRLARAVPPNGGTLGCDAATTVVEIGCGGGRGLDVLVGDRIVLEP